MQQSIKNFALVGKNLLPQIEKEINSALFLLSGVHASYRYIELESQSLESALDDLDGFNVATPYKQDIIKYLSNIAEDVELLQSVNTVKRSGKYLVGYNTDSYGFMQTLKTLNILPPKSFCIVGTNATARAIAVELANWGANCVEIAVQNTNSQDLKTTLLPVAYAFLYRTRDFLRHVNFCASRPHQRETCNILDGSSTVQSRF